MTAGRVLVVGAGMVGVSAAIWLQRGGVDVELVDRADPGQGASWGNAGVLAASSVVPVTVPGLLARAPRMLLDPRQPLFLRWRYLPRLLPWLLRYLRHATTGEANRIAAILAPLVGDSVEQHRALAEGTGAESFLLPSDYLFLYRDRAAHAADSFGRSLRLAHGFPEVALEGAALREYDPAIAAGIGFAARLPDHGRIRDPGAYIAALARYFRSAGGRIRKASVDRVLHRDGRVVGVRAGGETLAADTVIVAAGAWSGPLARGLGVDVPLESERGYHLEFREPSVQPRAPMMVAAGKCVLTPMDGRLRIAGLVEFGGLAAPPSPRPFALLRRVATATLPGLAWKRELRWMGHRPATADSIPVIGRVPGVAGACLAFGHHHVGLTAGPKTGRLLAGLVTGRRSNIDLGVDLEACSPSRFAAARQTGRSAPEPNQEKTE